MAPVPSSRTPGLAALAALALACGDGIGPAIEPAELRIVGGNLQCGLAGAPLPLPLEVLVVGSTGLPFEGADIRWAPVDGTVEPAASATDRFGRTRTIWTLSSASSEHTLTARSGSLAPATFSARALDPAVVETPYTLGESVTAMLVDADCGGFNGRFVDFHVFESSATSAVEVVEMSTDFLPHVAVLGGDRRLVAGGEDLTGESRLRILVPAGTFVIAAGTRVAGAGGAYELATTLTSPGVSECADVWIARGVATMQQIETTDCLASGGEAPVYADRFRIHLYAGDAITVAQNSSDVDASLTLLDAAGIVRAHDDDGGAGVNALLQFTAPQTSTYVIEASTAFGGQTGAYTLSVT